jgi:hypothetical protein
MPFIQMAHFGPDTESAQEAPTDYAEHQFLFQAEFRTAAVQFASDAAMMRQIGGIIGIQQVQPGSPDLDLPGANPDPGAWERERDSQPFAAIGP